MLDHVGVQAADVDAASRFYLQVFAPLGRTIAQRFPVPTPTGESSVVGFAGPDGFPRFWLSPMTAPPATGSAGPAPEAHVAFAAPDRAAAPRRPGRTRRQRPTDLNPPTGGGAGCRTG